MGLGEVLAAAVSFLFTDLIGQQSARFTEEAAAQQGQDAEQIPLASSIYDEVLRTQRPARAPGGGMSAARTGGCRRSSMGPGRRLFELGGHSDKEVFPAVCRDELDSYR